MLTQNHKILIYSADVDLCKSISLLLQTEYEIKYVTASLSNIDMNIDLLIVDVPISDGDLINTLKLIKSKQPNIKILLLYAYKIYNKEIENSYRTYSDFLLYKPIDIYQLINAVKKLILKTETYK